MSEARFLKIGLQQSELSDTGLPNFQSLLALDFSKSDSKSSFRENLVAWSKVSDYSSIWSVCTCNLKNHDFWRPKSMVFQRTVPDYVCCPVCFHDKFISKMLNLRHPGHPSGSFSCHPEASRPSHRLKGRQHNSLPPISAAGSFQSVSQHWICIEF